MSQPVKLSDPLVADAREAGQIFERSIASQIEYWASLGRALEPFLRWEEAAALRRRARQLNLKECLDAVDSEIGHQRLQDVLEQRPYPHYEAHPTEPGYFVRIEEDGSQTVGKFQRRQFVPHVP